MGIYPSLGSADKNGSDLGQKPDPNMRIKMGASERSLIHVRIKVDQRDHNERLATFALTSSLPFCFFVLTALQKSPIIPRNGQPGLEVSQEDADLFKVLCKRHQDIVKAVKAFNKCKTKSMQNDLVDEEMDEGE